MKGHGNLDVLEEIQQRVRWLASRIAAHDGPRRGAAPWDHRAGGRAENSGRPADTSLASVLTALWFGHLEPPDRVSVTPSVAPVSRAIEYLLGRLDRNSLTAPPDWLDHDAGILPGSAAGAVHAGVARRYVDAHFGERPRSRFYAVLGDAELSMGEHWGAVYDPSVAGLGSVTWVVGARSPGQVHRLAPQFESAGWHVVELRYGRLLRAAFDAPGGELLRGWIDAMPADAFAPLARLTGGALRAHFLDGAPAGVASVVAGYSDDELGRLVTDVGGHDLPSLLGAFAECDDEKDAPSVVLAPTVQGWASAAGQPWPPPSDLHASSGLDPVIEWDRLDPATPAGQWAAIRREELTRTPRTLPLPVRLPSRSGIRVGARPVSTEDAFSGILVELERMPELAPYLVTAATTPAAEGAAAAGALAAPDVLAGLINRVGVFAPTHQRAWSEDPGRSVAEGPDGHHIQLGRDVRNLAGLLGQLGRGGELFDQPLLPIGAVAEDVLGRDLDALAAAARSGARFVLAGVTRRSPDGAGCSAAALDDLAGVTVCEPAYAGALDWLVCAALRQIAAGPVSPGPVSPGPVEQDTTRAYYFRLTNRAVDQGPFEAARARLGESMLRQQVLSGAYRLVDASALAFGGAPEVHLVGSGSVLPDIVAAASELADEGIAAHVVDVTSPGQLFSAWRRTLVDGIRTATVPGIPGLWRTAFGHPVPGRRVPLVVVARSASRSMTWLGSALGVACVPLGLDEFVRAGEQPDVPGTIVNAALAAMTA